jgi:hypothetical protein
MSLVDSGWHYIRDRVGPEQLYDLRNDPSETRNLVGSAPANIVLDIFRRRLLDALNSDPGSAAVENAYLARFRRLLQADVRTASSRPPSLSATEPP